VTPVGRLKVCGVGVSEALAGEVVPAGAEDLLQLQRDDVVVSQQQQQQQQWQAYLSVVQMAMSPSDLLLNTCMGPRADAYLYMHVSMFVCRPLLLCGGCKQACTQSTCKT